MSAQTAPKKHHRALLQRQPGETEAIKQWLGDGLNLNTKGNACWGQVQLQGASGMEGALHTAGPRDHVAGLILELETASLQKTHHRANQLCATANSGRSPASRFPADPPAHCTEVSFMLLNTYRHALSCSHC